MNLDLMIELSEDIVKFHPGDMAGVFDVDASNTDFLIERQSTFESIKRTTHNVTQSQLKVQKTILLCLLILLKKLPTKMVLIHQLITLKEST